MAKNEKKRTPVTVADLIKLLSRMKPTLPVCVSDGIDFHFYDLDSTVTVEEIDSEIGRVCDIGVGYCRVD